MKEVRVEFKITYFGKEQHKVEKILQCKPAPNGGWMIRESAPELCGGSEQPFFAWGSTVSQAVLSWLTTLCGSMEYVPEYKRQELRLET